MKRLWRILVLACIGILSTPIIPVFAVANPDSIVVSTVAVFSSVIDAGDQLVYARYDINYAAEPSEDASTTFLMAIYDTDGTTLLYTRPVLEYQNNVISIYLTSAQALTVGNGYAVRIMGNPAVFDPLIENTNMDTWTLSAGDYFDGSLMGDFIVAQAAILEVDIAVDLLTANNKLNTAGSVLFKSAIPGLNNMAPTIFETTSVGLTPPTNPFNNSYGNTAGSRIGTMNTAFADIGAWMGIGQVWAQVMVCSVGAFILASVMFAVTQKPEMGVVGAAFATVGFAWIGWFPLQALMIGVAFIAIMFGIVFIMAKIG